MRPAALLIAACGGATPADGPDTDAAVDTEVVETDVVETDDTDETDLPVDPCLVESPALVLTAGDWDDPEPLVAGQDLPITHGAGGGWGLRLGVEADQVEQPAILRVTVTDATSGASFDLEPSEYRYMLTPHAGVGTPWACGGSVKGIWVWLDLSDTFDAAEPWAPLCGRAARIGFSLSNMDDVFRVGASVDVVLQPDPEDGPPCDPT